METLCEVRPAFLFGVPRVFEKIQEKMVEMGRGASYVQRLIADWAKGEGLSHNMRLLQGEEQQTEGFAYSIAKRLVFSKVKGRLGLDGCRFIGVGAAPLSLDTIQYFASLDLPMSEGYGMSETMGPHNSNNTNIPGGTRMGTVGPPLPGMKTDISSPGSDGEGEVLMYGRNVMMGYLFEEKETAKVFTGDGWLHSGDMGSISPDGFLTITGRMKELIVTAGGENVPHAHIEDSIRKEITCVSNAMLIGDKRKFLSCLLTLKVDVDADTQEPTESLSPSALKWCEEVGSEVKTVGQAMESSALKRAIQEGIDRVNSKAASNAQKVQKWCILPVDFSLPGGELGPTMKLKRHFVLKKYAEQIEMFYAT